MDNKTNWKLSGPGVVVLSLPCPSGRFMLSAIIARLKQLFRWILCHLRGRSPVSGPLQVELSAVRGFRGLGFNVRHNPLWMRGNTELIYVPRGLKALEQALSFKAIGRVRAVAAGPNNCAHPKELGLDAMPALPDIYLQPCEWARAQFERMAPSFPCPIVVGIAGVDLAVWSPPSTYAPKNEVIIYDKCDNPELSAQCIESVENHGLRPVHLIYGKFDPASYREALSRAKAVIYLAISESQGIAQFEAWAMDIPTFVIWLEPRPMDVSPSPYLCEETGALFRNQDELANLLDRLIRQETHYAPRDWMEKHASDSIAVQRWLSALNSAMQPLIESGR